MLGRTSGVAPGQGPGDPAHPSGDDRPAGHRVRIAEAGSFCSARCTCGWFASARRSRDRARRDADEHLASGATTGPGTEATG